MTRSDFRTAAAPIILLLGILARPTELMGATGATFCPGTFNEPHITLVDVIPRDASYETQLNSEPTLAVDPQFPNDFAISSLTSRFVDSNNKANNVDSNLAPIFLVGRQRPELAAIRHRASKRRSP